MQDFLVSQITFPIHLPGFDIKVEKAGEADDRVGSPDSKVIEYHLTFQYSTDIQEFMVINGLTTIEFRYNDSELSSDCTVCATHGVPSLVPILTQEEVKSRSRPKWVVASVTEAIWFTPADIDPVWLMEQVGAEQYYETLSDAVAKWRNAYVPTIETKPPVDFSVIDGCHILIPMSMIGIPYKDQIYALTVPGPTFDDIVNVLYQLNNKYRIKGMGVLTDDVFVITVEPEAVAGYSLRLYKIEADDKTIAVYCTAEHRFGIEIIHHHLEGGE